MFTEKTDRGYVTTLKNLPWRFIQDCLECDCEIGDTDLSKGRRVTLQATAKELAELRNRAEYYADSYGPQGGGAPGLRIAARALLKHLPATDG